MIELNYCPICNNNDLSTLLSTLSRYDESYRSHNVAILNHILKNVLLKDEVLVYTKQCRRCKQMFVSPTFSPEEMARLYSEEGNKKMHQFYKLSVEKSGLSYIEDFSGDETLGKKYIEESKLFRGKFIYDVVTSFEKKPINKLLDIGGGEGSNILSFHKSEKYVYDLVTPSSSHGQIKHINNLSVARSLAPFDLLVSTHTLEHIINLRETVESYAGLMRRGSLFYVEVPAEYTRIYAKYLLYPILKKGTHINWHINYLSPGSLQTLFAACGYNTLYLKTRFMAYDNLRMPVIVGLFKYTGISDIYFSSWLKWYRDFFTDILIDIKIKGFRKVFKRYPSLTSFK
jgi:2-polyprenyl-3-methyl-5-hydroxy-6-metoxy-1,4-benzoquinol methylase